MAARRTTPSRPTTGRPSTPAISDQALLRLPQSRTRRHVQLYPHRGWHVRVSLRVPAVDDGDNYRRPVTATAQDLPLERRLTVDVGASVASDVDRRAAQS